MPTITLAVQGKQDSTWKFSLFEN